MLMLKCPIIFPLHLHTILALGACPLNTPILRPRLDFSRPSAYADGYRMRDWWFFVATAI